ncbi:MAG: hypothetical protein HQ564_06290, partial [Candidatus Saganbacteria bacterium]|nr:hypothetical protein [Candidatus Saganbacteria bacterium]
MTDIRRVQPRQFAGRSRQLARLKHNALQHAWQRNAIRANSPQFVRRSVLNSLYSSLVEGKDIIIAGSFRTGKSTMLFSLLNKVENNARVVYSPVFHDCFMKDIQSDISCKYQIDVEEDDPLGGLLNKVSGPVYLFLEEGIRFHGGCFQLSSYLNDVKKRFPSRIRVAIVFHTNPIGEFMLRRDFSDFRIERLKPLDINETMKMITLNGRIDIFNSYANEIFKISGGIPFLISIVCKKLTEIISEQGDLYEVSDNIRRFFENDNLSNLSRGIMGMEGLVYNCLSDDEQRVIQSIALG